MPDAPGSFRLTARSRFPSAVIVVAHLRSLTELVQLQ
jgi:hypothetical protein